MTKVDHKIPAEQREKRIRQAQGMSVEEQLDTIWEILADLVDGKEVSRRDAIDQMKTLKERIKKNDTRQ